MTENFAGWHPDPLGRHEHRYFDGSEWTEHVADKGEMGSDPIGSAEPVTAPTTPSMVNLPAITPGMAQSAPQPAREDEPAAAAPPEPAAPEPTASAPQPEPVAPQPPPQAAAPPMPDPGPAPTQQATAPTAMQPPVTGGAPGKSLAVGALLSVVAPGSGHAYLGQRRELASGLLVATIVALVLSYIAWPIGLVLWAVAAAFALATLWATLAPMRQGRGALSAFSDVGPQLSSLLLAVGGGVLAISPILPWYRLSASVAGIDFTDHVSGFTSYTWVDIIAVVAGLIALVVGLMGLTGQSLPPVATSVATAAAAVAVAFVGYRLLFTPGDAPEGASVDRTPGIWIAFDAALVALVGGLGAIASSRRSGTAP